MSSTVIALTRTDTGFEHYAGRHNISNSGMAGPYLFMMPRVEDVMPEGPGILEIHSPNPKIFISLNAGPYHFFQDNVGPLLRILEEVKNAEVYIDASNIQFDIHNKFYGYIYKVLDDRGIKYQQLPLDGVKSVNTENFYVLISNMYINNAGNRIFEESKKYIKDLSVKPYRNVYLSRKYMGDRNWETQILPGLSANHDNRIDNEPMLEEYFRSKGFEIIIPEEFETFEDQINLFYTVKTIASLTSSGLTNAFFMQPNQTMIELMTPLVTFHGFPANGEKAHAQEAMHHFYQLIATNRGHNYAGIPNITRKAEDVINKIESDRFMSEFFNRK